MRLRAFTLGFVSTLILIGLSMVAIAYNHPADCHFNIQGMQFQLVTQHATDDNSEPPSEGNGIKLTQTHFFTSSDGPPRWSSGSK